MELGQPAHIRRTHCTFERARRGVTLLSLLGTIDAHSPFNLPGAAGTIEGADASFAGSDLNARRGGRSPRSQPVVRTPVRDPRPAAFLADSVRCSRCNAMTAVAALAFAKQMPAPARTRDLHFETRSQCTRC